MVKLRFCTYLFLFIYFSALFQPANAQLVKDLSRQIEIEQIINLKGTETHLYALSEREGLVVFRTYSDSLQWLYSSTGMQERGNRLDSDIRFAYLYGDSRRLTVIEPTSVLGVYSSTILPATPLSVKRIGLRLFVAMGSQGVGIVNLETPESVDEDSDRIETINHAINLASDGSRVLYVLANNNSLSIIDVDDDSITIAETISIDRTTKKIFLIEDELIGASDNGDIFFINSEGDTRLIGNVNTVAERITQFDDLYIIRTETGALWQGTPGNFEQWKPTREAGNFTTLAKNTLWYSEFATIAPLRKQANFTSGNENNGSQDTFKLQELSNVILPIPRPLIIPIEFENDVDLSQVTFSYQAPFNNARIRGNSFYWQPTSTQSGRHEITITATSADGKTDNTTFTADIRAFNSPPRFTPTRPVSIPVDESFELTLTAVDPDGPNPNLIRYLGVDMPDGASLEESTGVFRWSPTVRQVGNHKFQVIATDQFGAASSQNFEINVIEINVNEELDEDLF